MDLVQLAGVFFLGTEKFNSSNSMMATVVLKEKIDQERLFPSYRALIAENPLLQTKIVERPEKNGFCWDRFSPDELESLFCFEREQLAGRYVKESVLRQYFPTNERLPFYLAVVDDYTVIVSMHHALANGRCFIYWIQKWLRYYAGDLSTAPEKAPGGAPGTKFSRMMKRIGAFLWLPFFMAGFFLRAGRNSSKDTVDLSRGRIPCESQTYVTRAYRFSGEDTKRILQKCRTARMTLTEFMCVVLVDALLGAAPEKRRAFISLPMDMHALVPYSPENTYGNLITSLPSQFFRGRKTAKQVKSAFRWLRRGIPYSLSCLFAAVSRSYEKSRTQCLELSKKTIPERSPLWDFSLTYSNLGVISYPVMERLVESIYFYFKSQSVLLASSTLSGKMTMKLSFSRELYDPQEIFGIFDRILSVEYLMKYRT